MTDILEELDLPWSDSRSGESVTVIIPTYNGSNFIEETIRSVFSQSRPPDQLIIVDDKSTDDTIDIVKALQTASPIPLMIVVRSENSGGPVQPLKAGIELATSDWIAFLDQDDTWSAGRIETLLLAVRLRDSIKVVFNEVRSLRLDGSVDSIKSADPDVFLGELGDRVSDFVYIIRGSSLMHWIIKNSNIVHTASSLMVRRATLIANCMPDLDYTICWDVDLICKICLKEDFLFVRKAMTFHRLHSNNLSGNDGIEPREMNSIRTKLLPLLGDNANASDIRLQIIDYWTSVTHTAANNGQCGSAWLAVVRLRELNCSFYDCVMLAKTLLAGMIRFHFKKIIHPPKNRRS
jgi:glycosyltransferase involved in cell wall biosynthesis